ncbi:VOC family protein [Actinospica sp. MGRD01-02]|uniref:VOC family protein n=1 Tax=Actinospica acidithermotolerans TaxID=2828514 RepID=A0A941IJY7_9ACTN|nr:VOC family protein [Actinospica acidithermotolerans]MBR7829979.1 VOC family protein [Actinospica acidithermotolerans]
MASQWWSIVVDCADPQAQARWWAEALRYAVVFEGDGEVAIAGGTRDAPQWPGLVFVQVPEGKAVKNRLHLDLNPDDQDAEVARLEALGARRVDVGQRDVGWVVLADPEGNEFCVLSARPQG